MPLLNASQLCQRIDQKHDAQAGALALQVVDLRQVIGGENLVGDEAVFCAGSQRHLQLCDVGHRHAPGAGVELALKELRRQRRLAMRGEVHPLPARKVLHPLQVVLQALLAHHGDGKWQITTQDIPALAANL